MPSSVVYNRETLYRFLSDNTDANNNVALNQQQVAKIMGIDGKWISKIYKEFVDLGLLEKNGFKFTVLYNPDQIPWGKKYEELRKQYSEHQRIKHEPK